MIRVIIADDHHLVRQGIRALLDKEDTISVIGEAADGQQAIDLVQQLTPDVAVVDISMPRLDGTQAIERICKLGLATRVIILSMHSDVTVIQQVLKQGARGYLLKRSVTEELILAIRSAYNGEIYLSPAISEPILANLLSPQPAKLERNEPGDMLTPREREVLQLIAEGHTNSAIAEIMSISVKTVEKHRANVMSKLNVNDLAGLIRTAIKQNLIFPGDE
jgi:DNA-binding NarL/FixJ family response regulator